MKYVTTKLSRSVRALVTLSDAESLLEVQSPIVITYLKKLKVPLTPCLLLLYASYIHTVRFMAECMNGFENVTGS